MVFKGTQEEGKELSQSHSARNTVEYSRSGCQRQMTPNLLHYRLKVSERDSVTAAYNNTPLEQRTHASVLKIDPYSA